MVLSLLNSTCRTRTRFVLPLLPLLSALVLPVIGDAEAPAAAAASPWMQPADATETLTSKYDKLKNTALPVRHLYEVLRADEENYITAREFLQKAKAYKWVSEEEARTMQRGLKKLERKMMTSVGTITGKMHDYVRAARDLADTLHREGGNTSQTKSFEEAVKEAFDQVDQITDYFVKMRRTIEG